MTRYYLCGQETCWHSQLQKREQAGDRLLFAPHLGIIWVDTNTSVIRPQILIHSAFLNLEVLEKRKTSLPL